MSNLKRVDPPQYLSLQNVRLYVPPKELVQPAKSFIGDPRSAWLGIFANSETFKGLFEKYVFFLAAIPAVSGFLGKVLFGHAGVMSSLLSAIIAYLFSIAFLYGAAHLAYRTVRVFDGTMNLDTAGKLIVYSFMPFFICGLFLLLPPISWLSLIGLYSVYLFYQGVHQLSGITKHKQLPYFMLNVIAWIVVANFALELL